jgi:type IV secretory pathway VirB2 component (pilin)
MSRSTRFSSRSWLRRGLALVACAFVLGLMLAQPVFAQLDISSKATTAVEAIKTGVKFVLIVAVMGSGVLAAFGRMSWTTVGQVLIGSIIAGLATEVVSALYGA